MKTRTNIKLIPNSETIRNISNLLIQYNIEHKDFLADPHCTIIYSSDFVNVNDIFLPLELPMVGKNACFELFYTQYDGIVLVIEFECESAKKCFEYVKQEYGLSTRYEEYRAHITIQKNLENIKINLPKIPFEIVFDKIETDNGL